MKIFLTDIHGYNLIAQRIEHFEQDHKNELTGVQRMCILRLAKKLENRGNPELVLEFLNLAIEYGIEIQ